MSSAGAARRVAPRARRESRGGEALPARRGRRAAPAEALRARRRGTRRGDRVVRHDRGGQCGSGAAIARGARYRGAPAPRSARRRAASRDQARGRGRDGAIRDPARASGAARPQRKVGRRGRNAHQDAVVRRRAVVFAALLRSRLSQPAVAAGTRIKMRLFVGVLSYSRRCYVRAFRSQRHDDWREGLAGAFHHVRGVPADGARRSCEGADRRPRRHSGDCASGVSRVPHRLGRQRAGVPAGSRAQEGHDRARRRPREAPGAGGLRARSWAALEALLVCWIRWQTRDHGTTHDAPRERFERDEAAALGALPACPSPVPRQRELPARPSPVRQQRETRKVAPDCFVDVDTVRYSVPHRRLVRHSVQALVGDAEVIISDGTEVVGRHARCPEPRRPGVDPAHFGGLCRLMTVDRIIIIIIIIGAATAPYSRSLESTPRHRRCRVTDLVRASSSASGSAPVAERLDSTRLDSTRLDSTRLDSTRRDATRLDATRRDTTRHDATRRDTTRRDATRHDTTRHDTTRHDATRRDTTRCSRTPRAKSPPSSTFSTAFAATSSIPRRRRRHHGHPDRALSVAKALADFDFKLHPSIDAKLVRELATGRFIAGAKGCLAVWTTRRRQDASRARSRSAARQSRPATRCCSSPRPR